MQGIIRVLVVDDSAFVRKVVTQMLSRSPFIEVVGFARDGNEALEQVAALKPDVVTLDLMMPGLDGLGFLKVQMALAPVAVVLCSIADQAGVSALEALDAGAVDVVQKPTALATDRVYEIADELIDKVKSASRVNFGSAALRPPGVQTAAPTARSMPKPVAGVVRRAEIVLIGISTGGPQALRQMIPQIPADFPVPIIMVLHMPVGYTEMYAQRLNAISALEVMEGRDGQEVRPGTAVLAPAGKHLTLSRDAQGVTRIQLSLNPLGLPHRPAVDVLFKSGAEVYGSGVLGVVMTGMGDDGLLGAAHIKAVGGRIITESESSCVVYGMPRAVADAGLSDQSSSLETMAQVIMEQL